MPIDPPVDPPQDPPGTVPTPGGFALLGLGLLGLMAHRRRIGAETKAA
ncbi:MAG: MYXO-CTERM sorting domain-containing protein [Pseudomonadota bacterium]